MDIKKAGAFKYIESPAFEILLIAYAWDDDPVQELDLLSEPFLNDLEPQELKRRLGEVIQSLQNPEDAKVAHNCVFERTSFHKYTGHYMPPEQWEDTMILCAYNGLPMSLDAAGEALGIVQKKMKEGKALINYFCKPCKPTKANGGRTRNLPGHAPEKWQTFKRYCRRDVEAMREIHHLLEYYKVTPFERRVFCCDARINERGAMVDLELARSAVYLDDTNAATYLAEMQKLTGLENPKSVVQLKGWLAERGIVTESLDKAAVADLLSRTTDPIIRRVLELRQLLGKASTAKYKTMLAAAGAGDRVRGITQYYGAGRTGRWAGRLVQLQNLPQNHLEGIEYPRELVRQRDLETLELIYPSLSDTLSQLIRTALIAKPGHTFLVADYSAIEARVTAYLANCSWRREVFAKNGDIYCASASQMFHVPVVKHGVNGHLRQKGKIAELALGYGGGIGALKAFGADKMGLSEPEMQEIVTHWRAASPEIPRFWREAENAAVKALQNPGRSAKLKCGVVYRKDRDGLRCRLPSGRWLTYWGAQLDPDGSITYMGKAGDSAKWVRKETWGGKLVENIVQAYARDCLAVAMLRLDAAGYNICFHVHDEIIAEQPEGSRWEDMAAIMGQPIDWAPGLILNADGYCTKFYMKD